MFIYSDKNGDYSLDMSNFCKHFVASWDEMLVVSLFKAMAYRISV